MSVKSTFDKSVAKRIGSDRNHGWGVSDSLEVIIDLLVDTTGAEEIREDKELITHIKEVINPSQFRQKLETAKVLNKAATKTEKGAVVFAEIAAAIAEAEKGGTEKK